MFASDELLMSAEVAVAILRKTGVSFRTLLIARGPTIQRLATAVVDDICG
ncbi:MAG TPA: hypothetical protein VF266_11360 [Thermoanaerobaculia bacterium]